MKKAFRCTLVLLLWPALSIQAATTVTNIAAGTDHSLFIKSDGSLWGMEANYGGQLGDGTFNSTNKPEQIVSWSVVEVVAGRDYSLFRKSDGSLWGMGVNGNGEVGVDDGTNIYVNTPKEIVSSGVVAVAAGDAHSLFVKSDRSLWGMGWTGLGQLGDGTDGEVFTPEEIASSEQVSSLLTQRQPLLGRMWSCWRAVQQVRYVPPTARMEPLRSPFQAHGCLLLRTHKPAAPSPPIIGRCLLGAAPLHEQREHLPARPAVFGSAFLPQETLHVQPAGTLGGGLGCRSFGRRCQPAAPAALTVTKEPCPVPCRMQNAQHADLFRL